MPTPLHFTYKSYAWSLGTTSFRMKDFHRKVELQLLLLNEFWKENNSLTWSRNQHTQKKYYDFLFEKEFITGLIQDDRKKAKTARQKTSGLVDIGLIDDERRLTEVGFQLLKMSQENNFSCDNDFKIPSDSFLYLKQLLKTSYSFEDGTVRPFLITGKVLSECDDYLSDDEFTFLLPLCTTSPISDEIINKISLLRAGKKTIDEIIVESVLTRYSYPDALNYFLDSFQTADDIMAIGMNRDGASHDFNYVDLYKQLKEVYLYKNRSAVPSLMNAARKISGNSGILWRKLLFRNVRRYRDFSDLAINDFDRVDNENDFNKCFFKHLHLHKIKATLSDYKDFLTVNNFGDESLYIMV